MGYHDLRDFINKTDQMGELFKISGAHWDIEIGALTELTAKSKTLLFDDIPGYPKGYRVLSNVLTTYTQMKEVLGIDQGLKGKVEMARAFKDRLKEHHPLPTVEVDSGPVLENVQRGEDVDVLKFPTPRWHEMDGGRFIGTGHGVVTMDPDSQVVNSGTYRVMIHDKNLLGCYMSPGRHGLIHCMKHWERGRNAPVAVVCGYEPSLFVASGNAVATGVSEYEFAGWLRQKPIEVVKGPMTGILVPAYAEIVVEGEIPPPSVETRPDGPFGEWRGYYDFDPPKPRPNVLVIRVTSVLHRNDPIILGAPPLKPPLTGERNVISSGMLWHDLEEKIGVPDITGVWALESGGPRLIFVVALKQRYGGHAMHAAMAVGASRTGAYHNRLTVVVDDDIDPSDPEEVLWAIATRTDPATDFTVIPQTWFGPGDNRLGPEKRAARDFAHSKVIINACRPYYWKDKFPPVNKISSELREKTLKKWSGILAGIVEQ